MLLWIVGPSAASRTNSVSESRGQPYSQITEQMLRIGNSDASLIATLSILKAVVECSECLTAGALRWVVSRMPGRADDIISFFFFFQAEDGIRDYKVTGVQTCALP